MIRLADHETGKEHSIRWMMDRVRKGMPHAFSRVFEEKTNPVICVSACTAVAHPWSRGCSIAVACI